MAPPFFDPRTVSSAILRILHRSRPGGLGGGHDQLDRAREFVRRAFAPQVKGDPLALQSLDQAFSNFLVADSHDPATANAAVIAVGVARSGRN